MRGARILAQIEAAIADAPGLDARRGEDEVRVRGRGLRRRWISDPGLRFARRIRR
jgi:hypothetical protein